MTMPIRLLLIEDDPEHADLIRTHIARKHGSLVQITWAKRLDEGLERLADTPTDALLLDLGLPDSPLDKTLESVLPLAKGIPVVVLSSLEDEEFAIKAVHQGAQDYLRKSQLNGELLFRSLCYSIERKATEETLRAANRAKDEFLATLSHELRTPVSIIHGFAELACQGSMSEADRQHALETILRHSKLQVRLIDDLLDMSRIITGKLMLQSQAVELGPIVTAAAESVRLAAQSKGISLQIVCDAPIGLIQGDPVRIQQILWNLLSNAIKFTSSDGRIEVRLKRIQSQVRVEVEDTGIGIDPDFLPYVFDRFRQQDGSMSRRVGGLGLGLAIVKYLVELHGGQVSAASAGLGKGATFAVSLPLMAVRIGPSIISQVEMESANRVDGEPESPHETSPTLNGVHVMAIDDSPDTLMQVGILLRRSGATVSTARSSAEALGVLRTLKPDVIVCDIGMPDENGYVFLRKLRADETCMGRRHVPAAALTAYARREERQEAFRAGFQIHLVKPIDEKALVTAIAGLVGSRLASDAR